MIRFIKENKFKIIAAVVAIIGVVAYLYPSFIDDEEDYIPVEVENTEKVEKKED
jgi:hypothetical protein